METGSHSPPTPRDAAVDADGRLVCWRCKCDLDVDFYCDACGATSRPPAMQPRVNAHNVTNRVHGMLDPSGALEPTQLLGRFAAHSRRAA